MRAVDTNVLVRLLTRDDDAQVAAAEAYISDQPAWVSEVVLVELAWVLDAVYELDRSRIAAALEMLLEQERVVVQNPEVVGKAVQLYRRGTGSDFADCMILELARGTGNLPLATFDRKLAKADGAQRI